jgi:hypothetical protein
VCGFKRAQRRTQDGKAGCLSGQDLSVYDYISVGKDRLVPMSVKRTSMSRLNHLSV